MRRDFLEVAIKLSEEYDIPFMLFRLTDEVRKMIYERNMGEPFVKALEKQEKYMVERGIPLLDALYSIKGTTVDQSEEFYKNIIRNLKPGVNELIIHLASPSKEIEAITNSYRQRIEDYRIFTSPEMKEFIKEQGVHLIGWKDLNTLWKERKQ